MLRTVQLQGQATVDLLLEERGIAAVVSLFIYFSSKGSNLPWLTSISRSDFFETSVAEQQQQQQLS